MHEFHPDGHDQQRENDNSKRQGAGCLPEEADPSGRRTGGDQAVEIDGHQAGE